MSEELDDDAGSSPLATVVGGVAAAVGAVIGALADFWPAAAAAGPVEAASRSECP